MAYNTGIICGNWQSVDACTALLIYNVDYARFVTLSAKKS